VHLDVDEAVVAILDEASRVGTKGARRIKSSCRSPLRARMPASLASWYAIRWRSGATTVLPAAKHFGRDQRRSSVV